MRASSLPGRRGEKTLNRNPKVYLDPPPNYPLLYPKYPLLGGRRALLGALGGPGKHSTLNPQTPKGHWGVPGRPTSPEEKPRLESKADGNVRAEAGSSPWCLVENGAMDPYTGPCIIPNDSLHNPFPHSLL